MNGKLRLSCLLDINIYTTIKYFYCKSFTTVNFQKIQQTSLLSIISVGEAISFS